MAERRRTARRNGRSAKGKEAKKATFTDKDKRKMDQELKKKYDAQRKAVQQERKKFEHDKKAMENEHKKLLKEKSTMDRLKGQIKTEKDGWLNRQKKAKVQGAPAAMTKINKSLKVWVKREVETKEEWVSITKCQGEMKQESSNIEDEREKLNAEQEDFLQKQNEFLIKCEEQDAQIKAAEEEQTRLENLEESYQVRDKQKEEHDHELERLSELLIVREQEVVEKGGKLDLERIQVDDLKKNLHSKLAEKRDEFIQKLSRLSSEVLKWNSSFVELFDGVGLASPEVGETKQEGDTVVIDLSKETPIEDYPKLDAYTKGKDGDEYEVMKEPEQEIEAEQKITELNESNVAEKIDEPIKSEPIIQGAEDVDLQATNKLEEGEVELSGRFTEV